MLDTAKEFNQTDKEKKCDCDHSLIGSGAVFYRSVGILYCVVCRGWQAIRKNYS